MLTVNDWQNRSSAARHSVSVMIAADDGAWAVDHKVQSALRVTVKVGPRGKGTLYRTERILDRAKHDVPSSA